MDTDTCPVHTHLGNTALRESWVQSHVPCDALIRTIQNRQMAREGANGWLTGAPGEIGSDNYWDFCGGARRLLVQGTGDPPQYSCLETPMGGGAWWAAVHGVAKSQTQLRDFTFPFPFHALEKEMATHSNVLAWRIPGTGEPGGLPSMGSHRVRHDLSDLAAAAAGDCSETRLRRRPMAL